MKLPTYTYKPKSAIQRDKNIQIDTLETPAGPNILRQLISASRGL